MRADFQIAGISAHLTDRLNNDVRYAKPLRPRCFKWIGVRPSGPVAVEFFDALMARKVSTEKGE